MVAKITECKIVGEQDIYRILKHDPPGLLYFLQRKISSVQWRKLVDTIKFNITIMESAIMCS